MYVHVYVAVTPLGELLFLRLHHVTPSVSHMARLALLFMCVYPLLDMTVSSPTLFEDILLSQYSLKGVATCRNTATMALQQYSWYHLPGRYSNTGTYVSSSVRCYF